MSIRDPPLIAVFTILAIGAYVLGALSYYAVTRCLSKAPNRRSLTQQVHIDNPGKRSSYGIDGSFTPTHPTSPSRFSFAKQFYLNTERHTSIGTHSSEVREDKVALQRDIEARPHPDAYGKDTSKLFSPPYSGATHTNLGPNDPPQTRESAVTATASQPFVNPTLVSPGPTMDNLKPVEIKASPSEQSLPTNHTRSCSVPLPLFPVVQRPPSTVASVAWHLPSRSRSLPKLRESSKYERSDSDHSVSVYGIPTPPSTATAAADMVDTNRLIVLDAKIFEASRTLKPSSSVYLDPLSMRTSIRSTPSPTLESIMQLYGSFPAPPVPTSEESTVETRPRAGSNASIIRVSVPTLARPTTAPETLMRPGRPTTAPETLVRPVRPLTIRPRRGGSISISPPQHPGLPNRPHTAGAKPSPSSSQGTLVSPNRIHRSTSANASLALHTEDSFLVPSRTAPTPRLATSSSLSNIRPKTPPRPTSSRKAVYFNPASTRPQPEGAMVNRRQI